MNPKFHPGEIVYYKNREYLVTRYFASKHASWIYEIIDQISGHCGLVDQSDILTTTEWHLTNQHNQNNIGWAAMKSIASENARILNGALNSKVTCVCGAHKVKDSRHSSWCEIKN